MTSSRNTTRLFLFIFSFAYEQRCLTNIKIYFIIILEQQINKLKKGKITIMIDIYTDGSSRGNPGEGGYAVVVYQDNTIFYQFSVQEQNVTNNQMELKAIIHAMEYALQNPEEIFIIHSDSSYCVKSCNEWIQRWAANGWQTTKHEEVENLELMQTLYKYIIIEFNNFQVVKTNGHVGIVGNELADALASNNFAKFKKIKEENDIKTCYQRLLLEK